MADFEAALTETRASVTEEMLTDYARIQETLKSDAVKPVGGIGFVLPGMLRPIYVAWMTLAMPIGWVVSHLLLLFVFYLVVTPIGLAMRLIGYDPLTRQLDRSAKSYWTPHDPSGEAARYFKQY